MILLNFIPRFGFYLFTLTETPHSNISKISPIDVVSDSDFDVFNTRLKTRNG